MKNKKIYYVGTFNNKGELQFVYEIIGSNKTCKWSTLIGMHKLKVKPLEMTLTSAENLADGLILNFTNAFVIKAWSGQFDVVREEE